MRAGTARASSQTRLESDPRFESLRKKLLAAFDSPDRLTSFQPQNGYVYDLWEDAKNPKGLWRRASLESYLAKKPEWKILLDIDALAKSEGENWVYSGNNKFRDRTMVELSRGGKDATVVREFDLATGQFVKDGFVLPEGKHYVTWLDENTLIVGRGDRPEELTESGYPHMMRLWKRGTSFDSATLLTSSDPTDVGTYVYASRDSDDGAARDVIKQRTIRFFVNEYSILRGNSFVPVPIPLDAELHTEKEFAYIILRSEWVYKTESYEATYPSGTLLRISIEDLLKKQGRPEVLFRSSRDMLYEGFTIINDRIFLSASESVSLSVVELKQDSAGHWFAEPLPFPANSNVEMIAASEKDQIAVFQASSFLQPATRYVYDLKTNQLRVFDRAKPSFDSSNNDVQQLFAKSKDGTMIPYYLVAPKNMKPSGSNPTIIDAYGGFEVSERPVYSASRGIGWLEKGGVYVVANIRGGGEFGPEWHKAALQEKRQTAYDDFHAVAEDLIARKITSPRKLGIVGGSNGGLLMGVAFTQRPDLYRAVISEVPLLDMLRFHKLLAGASWMGEYGNPEDPAMRRAIKRYSPYQNVVGDKKYPEVFFKTSTADDRVHPGHARRTAARMERLGHSYLYYENIEGGHGGASDNKQSAYSYALNYVYFMQKLMDEKPADKK